MSMQTIDIGQTANDDSGDPLRVAYSKINQNFSEVYSALDFNAGGLAILTSWQTGTLYKLGQIVVDGGTIYRCTVQHGSGNFASDLAAGKWIAVAVLPPGAAGQNGTAVRTGSAPPGSDDGVDGDFWIDRTAWTIYGPKVGGDWGAPTSLIGPPATTASDVTNDSGVSGASVKDALETLASHDMPAGGATGQALTKINETDFNVRWADKPILSVLDYGAVGDASTDNYTAFSNALTFAKSVGANLFVPKGAYVINMSSGRTALDVSAVHIIGEGIVEWISATTTTVGSWLLIKGTADSPFSIGRSGGFERLGWFWPDQTTPSSPTAYPIAIKANGAGSPANIIVRENLVVNAYDWLDLGTGGFNWILNNRIACFHYAISTKSSAAETWINGNNFSHAWGDYFYDSLSVKSDFTTYVENNAIALYFTGDGNVDAWHIENNTVFAFKHFIRALKTAGTGSAYIWANVTGNTLDSVYQGILFSGSFRPTKFVVSDNSFNYQGDLTTSQFHIAVNLSTTTSGEQLDFDMVVSGNDLSVSAESHIFVASKSGHQGHLVIAGNHLFLPGNARGAGSYCCVLINSPSVALTFTGNHLDGFSQTNALGIGIQALLSAVVSGNTFERLVAGFDNFATISGNLVISGNCHSSVGTPFTVGTVSGVLINDANSWTKDTGWAAWTGTGSKATKAVSSATTADCAAAIKSILDVMISRGMIGA